MKKGILDPNFRYIPSFDTDIKKRFDAIRRAQKPVKSPIPGNVEKLPVRRKA